MSLLFELIIVSSIVGYLAYKLEIYKESIKIMSQWGQELERENIRLLNIAEESAKEAVKMYQDIPEPTHVIKGEKKDMYASDCEEGTIFFDFIGGFTWIVTGEENEDEYHNRFVVIGRLFENSEDYIGE